MANKMATTHMVQIHTHARFLQSNKCLFAVILQWYTHTCSVENIITVCEL